MQTHDSVRMTAEQSHDHEVINLNVIKFELLIVILWDYAIIFDLFVIIVVGIF